MNTVNLADVAAAFARRPVPTEVIASVMPQIRMLAVAGVKEHFQRGQSPDGTVWLKLKHPRPDGGDRPLEDKGRLKASVRAESQGADLLLTASTPYANLHQFGGVVRPKRAKMLAIPITKEAKRVGSPRANRFPRPLFVLAKEDGPPTLAESLTDGTVRVHYVLRREVRIPPRPFLGFSRATQEKIERVIQDRVAQWVATLFGGQDSAGVQVGTYAAR